MLRWAASGVGLIIRAGPLCGYVGVVCGGSRGGGGGSYQRAGLRSDLWVWVGVIWGGKGGWVGSQSAGPLRGYGGFMWSEVSSQRSSACVSASRLWGGGVEVSSQRRSSSCVSASRLWGAGGGQFSKRRSSSCVSARRLACSSSSSSPFCMRDFFSACFSRSISAFFFCTFFSLQRRRAMTRRRHGDDTTRRR